MSGWRTPVCDLLGIERPIFGFSHTHFSGTGHSDLGDVLVMPIAGDVRTEPGDIKAVGLDYKELPRDVRPGDTLLLNDGLLRLTGEYAPETSPQTLRARGAQAQRRRQGRARARRR